MANETRDAIIRNTLAVSYREIVQNNPGWSKQMTDDYFYKQVNINTLAAIEDNTILQVKNNSEQISELDGGVGQSRVLAKKLLGVINSNLELTVEAGKMASRFKKLKAEVSNIKQLLNESDPSSQIKSLQGELNKLRSLIHGN